MALGDGKGNNNGGKKLFENQYYSRLGFKDYTNNSGKRLGFSFKSGMLLIDISKEKDGGFDYDTLVTVYVTPTKAKILLKQIEQFKKDRAEGSLVPGIGYGINTGMGEIQTVLIVNVDANDKTIITIGKIDAEGKYTQKEDFYLNENNFHYGIKWNNIETMDCDKEYHNATEFEQFEQIVKDFANSSNGAYAYANADLTRYDWRALMNKFNPIYDALGIERQGGNNNSRSSGSGFFNNNRNNNGGTSQHKSYDEMFGGEEDDE